MSVEPLDEAIDEGIWCSFSCSKLAASMEDYGCEHADVDDEHIEEDAESPLCEVPGDVTRILQH